MIEYLDGNKREHGKTKGMSFAGGAGYGLEKFKYIHPGGRDEQLYKGS